MKWSSAIDSGQYDLVVVNFANGDMVGHTGVLAAAIKAVEVVDACVGKILEAVQRQGGTAIVTADHGNCEQMIDPGNRRPAHFPHDVRCRISWWMTASRAKSCAKAAGWPTSPPPHCS